MITLPEGISYEEFLLYHLGEGLDLEELGVLHLALHTATLEHLGQKRRSGRKYIEHPMVVAMMAKELRLSIAAQAAALMHDTKDDGKISLKKIKKAFGKKFGRVIAYMVEILSNKGLSSKAYFVRIVLSSKACWEIPVVKIIDRWHNLVCPYGGNPEREVQMLRETLEEFWDMCIECRLNIPDHFRKTYDQMTANVISLARTRLNEIEPPKN